MKTCIFTVIKNEHKYLEEWIMYHLDLGIDTLFIFEDIGSDSHSSICEKFGNKVVLKPILDLFDDVRKKEIKHWKEMGRFIQSIYISTGIMWIKNNFDYDWCFSIDNDEFLTPTEPFPSLLTAFQGYDAIILYWKNFGASGRIKTPIYDKPTWEIFTKECSFTKEDDKRRNITKICFNMKRLLPRFIYGNHTALCNWVRTDFETSRQLPPSYDKLYIRHYMTRSFEEYVNKIKVRGDICPGHRRIEEFFEMNEDFKIIKEKLLKKYGTN